MTATIKEDRYTYSPENNMRTSGRYEGSYYRQAEAYTVISCYTQLFIGGHSLARGSGEDGLKLQQARLYLVHALEPATRGHRASCRTKKHPFVHTRA